MDEEDKKLELTATVAYYLARLSCAGALLAAIICCAFLILILRCGG